VQAPPWKTKPTWYEVSTQDHMIHSDNERRMAQRINKRQVIELDASHASCASQPGPAIDLIDEAARAADQSSLTRSSPARQATNVPP